MCSAARTGRTHLALGPRLVHGALAFWTQTTGTTLVAVERCSLLRMWMSAKGGRSAHRLLYLAAYGREARAKPVSDSNPRRPGPQKRAHPDGWSKWKRLGWSRSCMQLPSPRFGAPARLWSLPTGSQNRTPSRASPATRSPVCRSAFIVGHESIARLAGRLVPRRTPANGAE